MLRLFQENKGLNIIVVSDSSLLWEIEVYDYIERPLFFIFNQSQSVQRKISDMNSNDESLAGQAMPVAIPSGGKFKTSTHVTALDGIVNVNSLFTVAVFIGFSLTDPAVSATGQVQLCHADNNIVRRLIVFEVVSFSWFLFSSLVAQTLKLYINLLNNSDRYDPHKAEVDRRLLKAGLLGSALGSLLGSVFLMLSISNIVQVKLGVFACGGKTIWSVVTLGLCVGSALLMYFITSMYALFFVA